MGLLEGFSWRRMYSRCDSGDFDSAVGFGGGFLQASADAPDASADASRTGVGRGSDAWSDGWATPVSCCWIDGGSLATFASISFLSRSIFSRVVSALLGGVIWVALGEGEAGAVAVLGLLW